MLTEPPDLDRRELVAVLERFWSLHGVTIDYLPVGFGSHHWHARDDRGERRFVTVDDLHAGFQPGSDADEAFASLERALRTAVALRDEAGLEFVVAPLAADTGGAVYRLSQRYAVTVFPFVEGKSSPHGRYESRAERRRMGVVLGRLHAATGRIAAELPRREDFLLPSRAALEDALGDLGRVWKTGPFAEPTRALLDVRAADVESRLEEYDAMADRALRSEGSWVITHGEPHRANVIRGVRALRLVDWDTTLLAPRERDLEVLLDEDHGGWPEYAGESGAIAVDQEVLQLYRKRWALAEIAVYVALFRRPHERTEDTSKSWRNLTGYLTVSS
ncbi:MAG TPA: phosphotransferase [Gaiellaceae bacterium]|jgi:spectinomycin phosphotransferase